MSRPPRLPHYQYCGVARYFLTICTQNRVEYFRDAWAVSLVLDQFFYTAREKRIAVPAYCAMPDHLHLLAEGESERSDLKQFVNLAKQRAAYRFTKQCGKRLWQEGYYERVLRVEDNSEEVIRYIVTNPIRGGLVQRVTDYPFWGSSLYSREELLAHVGART